VDFPADEMCADCCFYSWVNPSLLGDQHSFLRLERICFRLLVIRRVGSDVSVIGVINLEAPFSVLNSIAVGGSLSARDFSIVGSSLSVVCFARLGTTLCEPLWNSVGR
jgi:hypothetical protein